MRGLYSIAVYLAAATAAYFLGGSFGVYEAGYILAWSLPVLATAILLEYGLVNFGVAMYFAVGAYAVALLYKYAGARDLFVGLASAMASGAALGISLGYVLGRLRGLYYALANLSISMVVYGVLVKFYWLTGGSNGVYVPRPLAFGHALNSSSLYWIAAISAGAGLLIMASFLESRLGRVAEGIRINELRATALGADPRLHVAAATALSGALAALGGALVAYLTDIVTPDYSYWTASGELVVAALIGALASRAYGFLVGAAVYQLLRLWSYQFASPELVIGSALLLIAAIWRRRSWRRSD